MGFMGILLTVLFHTSLAGAANGEIGSNEAGIWLVDNRKSSESNDTLHRIIESSVPNAVLDESESSDADVSLDDIESIVTDDALHNIVADNARTTILSVVKFQLKHIKYDILEFASYIDDNNDDTLTGYIELGTNNIIKLTASGRNTPNGKLIKVDGIITTKTFKSLDGLYYNIQNGEFYVFTHSNKKETLIRYRTILYKSTIDTNSRPDVVIKYYTWEEYNKATTAFISDNAKYFATNPSGKYVVTPLIANGSYIEFTMGEFSDRDSGVTYLTGTGVNGAAAITSRQISSDGLKYDKEKEKFSGILINHRNPILIRKTPNALGRNKIFIIRHDLGSRNDGPSSFGGISQPVQIIFGHSYTMIISDFLKILDRVEPLNLRTEGGMSDIEADPSKLPHQMVFGVNGHLLVKSLYKGQTQQYQFTVQFYQNQGSFLVGGAEGSKLHIISISNTSKKNGNRPVCVEYFPTGQEQAFFTCSSTELTLRS